MELLTIKQASEWASSYLNRNVTDSNISYLIQYARVKKREQNGATFVSKEELIKYYSSYFGKREVEWKSCLGKDLNWQLSFDYLKEADTTKHVHRLHPYKGKFIPQLVAYFLDSHTDGFKKQAYFKKGDIVLDPFAGSGTALVQSNELGMHAIGIDVSAFNSLIANTKIGKYDIPALNKELQRITAELKQFIAGSATPLFEAELAEELARFNNANFPVPEYKRKVRTGEVNELKYGDEKAKKFLPVYQKLVNKYNIQLMQKKEGGFLGKWYLQNVRKEIEFVYSLLSHIKDENMRKIASIVLSRTIRSCRATTHADLATLKEPINSAYYCAKHGKVCRPLYSIQSWWERYSKDTVNRLEQFDKLRTDTFQMCLTGDSRAIDIFAELGKANPKFAELTRKQKIGGIFSSPPYVGLIDYHEQHAYAYDLFGFERKDELEIGPLCNGQGREARESYITGISNVLINCKRFMADDYNVFLVANDKYNLYPTIADMSGMKIIGTFKRPVLNRTEKGRTAYAETIFHLKEI